MEMNGLVILGFFLFPIVRGLAKMFGLYAVVEERQAQVFTLFGKVIGTIDTPGLQFPIIIFGPRALLVPFFG
ncbi:MAG: hypothetical protein KDD55_04605, partial [Bdellovibrionales bacterium]|nr:hypothetical protein [Bdellovibrionales bacterium]